MSTTGVSPDFFRRPSSERLRPENYLTRLEYLLELIDFDPISRPFGEIFPVINKHGMIFSDAILDVSLKRLSPVNATLDFTLLSLNPMPLFHGSIPYSSNSPSFKDVKFQKVSLHKPKPRFDTGTFLAKDKRRLEKINPYRWVPGEDVSSTYIIGEENRINEGLLNRAENTFREFSERYKLDDAYQLYLSSPKRPKN